jgi:hypothetical protein
MKKAAASASSRPVRGGQDAVGVHQGELGEGPGGQRGPADDPVADGDSGHAGAGRDDLAAQLHPRGKRQRRAYLVRALAHQHVGKVRRRPEYPH